MSVKQVCQITQTAFIGLENALIDYLFRSRRHYTHPLYVQKLKEFGATQSMSQKGNCLDNAPIESFFGHMKDDVDIKACRTFEEVKVLAENYIDYYNNDVVSGT